MFFDDKLWDGVSVKETPKVTPNQGTGNDLDEFWDVSKNSKPKIETNPSITTENPSKTTTPLKTVNEEPKELPSDSIQVPKVQVTIREIVVGQNAEYDEKFAHLLNERLCLKNFPEISNETEKTRQLFDSHVEESKKMDVNSALEHIGKLNSTLMQRIMVMEDENKILRDIGQYNQDQFTKQLKILSTSLYTSTKIPLTTTNHGKHLSVVGKELLEIPSVYQDRLGGVIESLDFSWNRIKHVSNLDGFTRLISLVLDNNQIHHLTDFPYLPTLSTLWLNNNLIEDLDDALCNLESLSLKSASLLGNPCVPKDEVEMQKYRYHVLSRLIHLTYLDTHAVSSMERNESNKRKKIKEAFGKYQSDPESEDDEFEKRVKRVVKTQVKEIKKAPVYIQDRDILDDNMTPVEAFSMPVKKKETKSSVFEDDFWDTK